MGLVLQRCSAWSPQEPASRLLPGMGPRWACEGLMSRRGSWCPEAPPGFAELRVLVVFLHCTRGCAEVVSQDGGSGGSGQSGSCWEDLAWRVQLGLCSEVPVYSAPLHYLLL